MADILPVHIGCTSCVLTGRVLQIGYTVWYLYSCAAAAVAADRVVDPGLPMGEYQLPRRLCFENFVCRNERIWTLGTPSSRSANVIHILRSRVNMCWVNARFSLNWNVLKRSFRLNW